MTLRRNLMGAAGAGLVLPVPLARAGWFSSMLGKGEGLPEETDAIVVGAGGAGLAAAVSAAESGAKVLVLEKLPQIGGDTAISGGFFGAVDPRRQRALGIADSEELFYEQTFEGGDRLADPDLVRILTHEATASLAWLESMGMRFQDSVIEIHGALWARCHKPVQPAGTGYIQTLSARALALGVRIVTDSHVTGLVRDGRGRIAGVEVTGASEDDVRRVGARRGVILAAGGFGRNAELVSRIDPRMQGLTSTSAPGATGEMMLAAGAAGAWLRDLRHIQCMPGCPPGRTHRVRLHNDVSLFIFVDKDGRRFIREDDRRDALSDAMLALPGRTAFSITDDAALKTYSISMQKEAWQGIETGDAWRAATIESLAAKMGLPPETLARTIADYNKGVEAGADALGKSRSELRHTISHPPFWGCLAGVSVHYTMGGVAIDGEARCIDPQRRPVPGLWAAGEITGGVHGANRLGANGLADAITFGRIAGRSCAAS